MRKERTNGLFGPLFGPFDLRSRTGIISHICLPYSDMPYTRSISAIELIPLLIHSFRAGFGNKIKFGDDNRTFNSELDLQSLVELSPFSRARSTAASRG